MLASFVEAGYLAISFAFGPGTPVGREGIVALGPGDQGSSHVWRPRAGNGGHHVIHGGMYMTDDHVHA
jgi:hypothetical protein